jgi:molybdopterin converting factor small subunit
MRVLVTYHGIIGEMIGRKREEIDLPADATVADLRAHLERHGDRTAAVLKQARPFVAGHLVPKETALTDGAEVTFMRPIGGG